MSDKVNNPQHYNKNGIEVIDVIEAFGLGFCDGNVVKYLCRSKYKENQVEDTEKAVWYLQRHLAGLKKKETEIPF